MDLGFRDVKKGLRLEIGYGLMSFFLGGYFDRENTVSWNLSWLHQKLALKYLGDVYLNQYLNLMINQYLNIMLCLVGGEKGED